mgnify:CR=1 FL=1
MDVYVNIRRWGGHVLLAICDAELLGEKLQDAGIVFTVREDFYKGLRMDVDEAVNLISQCTIVNMVGRNIVKKAK